MSQEVFVQPVGAPRRLQLYGVSRARSACTYYRIRVPFIALENLGAVSYKIDDFETMEKQARVDWAMASDIHLHYLAADALILDRIRDFKKLKPTYNRDIHAFTYPPKVVFDADDDAESVDCWNPRFVRLGTRAPDGTPLKPGDQIFMEMGEGAEPKPYWIDGRTYGDGQTFDIAENIALFERMGDIIKESHGCTVTSEELAKVYRERYESDNVFVSPNSILFDDFPDIRLKSHGKRINILWQGGWSHYRDLYPLRESFGRVARKYPQANFMFWGQQFRWMSSDIPPSQRDYIDWVPFDAYHLRLATIGHDINLAPLANSPFNRCKSAIKFYESASLPRPVPTLAANVGPYKEIEHGDTGMLYDSPKEFEEHLGTLIEDASLRKDMGQRAKEWVHTYRDAHITSPALLEFYRSMQDG